MSPDDSPSDPPHHHVRRRRAKFFLRFVPRRASLHRYPVVGRFADFARRRAYLWSFRTQNLRPAFYAGSILSLLPVMGVQLPLALVLALLLRANFMVLGGLQFLTNPFTAAPIYYATHQLGAKAIALSGIGEAMEITQGEMPPLDLAADGPATPAPRPEPAAPPVPWSTRIGTAFNALVVGGVLGGVVLGTALDLLWRFLARHHPPAGKRHHSHSTRPARPAK